MEYPEFYNEVEHIILKDELSRFLGSSEEGIIDISYLDIVKMAGHSCAHVSGSYLMALKGLKELYGTGLPERGRIKVELRESLSDGNTGVSAQVLSNITGATADTGFAGMNGKFIRRGLLFFGADIQSNLRLTRLDTNRSVEVKYMPGRVVNPGEILQSALGPDATEESRRTFPVRWQKMVKTIFDNADKVIELKLE
ncbi:MAG: hypothetical protein GY790_01370 [Bacteroidetes bacterium]|nr:hypothetical protein [Bacteroidota bacterium]